MAHSRVIRVRYPVGDRRLVLRTDSDWHADVEGKRLRGKAEGYEFRVRRSEPFFYFKPVLLEHGHERWAAGDNVLAPNPPRAAEPLDVFPHFDPDSHCSECTAYSVGEKPGAGRHSVRVFLPPGYAENPLRHYPVLYMQDGHNLFFPDESFQGETWKVGETMKLLDSLAVIEPVIVVGITPNDRMKEYTSPGYVEYGRFLADELKPWVDARYRTKSGPEDTAVMGSSLGGVVSFHLAWSHPRVFGKAACLSSTFGFRDDLLARVAKDKARAIRVYLDSGWPRDNFEVTRTMKELLLRRGLERGRDLLHFTFPGEIHTERAWAMRAHLPFQFLFG